ncbi:MAG: type 1 glutamine amidotransferase domain-containing protein [Deltaproteobacteria bacterium]|nr:type 1 glutamine amidotransferase domain-containing protein [Deltaproteobacteria bacterium]
MAIEKTGVQPKVLVVLSGSDHVSLKGGGEHPTGYFLSELAVPLKQLIKAGYKPVFATPNGRAPTMDKVSDDTRWFKDKEEFLAAKALLQGIREFATPRPLDSFSEKELSSFDGLFVPGGHAPMEDLSRDPNLGRILNYFHQQQKPTALICHGPAALLSANAPGKPWPYQGYRMTVFSTPEEKQEEDAGHLDGYLTYYVADELLKAGASVFVASPWTGNVVRDRELITAQNPMSDVRFSEEFLEALIQRRVGALPQKKGMPKGGIEPNVVYDISAEALDWKNGYSTVFVGSRLKGSSPSEFLPHLTKHVGEVKQAFEPQGLRGYIVLATSDYEIAYLNWTSKEAADKAFASPDGKKVVADAQSFMESVLYKQTDER